MNPKDLYPNMDEIELLDKALDDCYGFENWISSMLCKLRDIDAATNAETNLKTLNSKRTRSAKKAKSKNKTKKETMHSRLNSDKSNNAINTNTATTSGKTSTAVENISTVATSSSDHNPNISKEAPTKSSTGITSPKKQNCLNKEEPKRPRSSTDSSDTDSNDSGISVRRRSSQECISAYTKVNKRYLQVKRSVESLMVEIRNMDEIINRQRDVFHINATGINNETYICHH